MQAELQQSKVQCGELEGRLSAADAVVTELRESRKKVGELESKLAQSDARMAELLESQKLTSHQVAVAMGHAQQHAASEYERLSSEAQATQQQVARTAHIGSSALNAQMHGVAEQVGFAFIAGVIALSTCDSDFCRRSRSVAHALRGQGGDDRR